MRKRIKSNNPVVQGGGGGGPVKAVVQWGPNFGEDPELVTAVAVNLATIATKSDVGAAAATKLTSLALKGDLNPEVAARFTNLSLDGGVSVQAAAKLAQLDTNYEAILEAQAAVDLTNQHIKAVQEVQAAAALAQVALKGALNPEAGITLVEYELLDYHCFKDSWVDEPTGCVGAGGNNNGDDLRVNSSVTAPQHAFVGWNFTTFPTNATVEEATITTYLKTTPVVTGTTSYRMIQTADEGWSESTVVCNNAPAEQAGSVGSRSNGTTGDITTSIPGARTQIGNRMGNGSFSLSFENSAATTGTAVFQSRDSGGSPGNNSGPRLYVRFTTPV